MDIEKKHRDLLKGMGLKEEDFALFDGKTVTCDFDDRRGVRLYDPFYSTSYNEYIGVDGWSAWTSEGDTFMTGILKGVREKTDRAKQSVARPTPEQLGEALMKRFGEETDPEAK
ncbi:MAG: hypothetical protein JW821_08410 [Deltaproteobacteria bacterium]|nr:hypothetical protein [Deltaproteobacteria bacterium]